MDKFLEPSKSEIKRQIKQVRDLVLGLYKLTIGQLQKIPLDETVYQAILELQQIKSNVAKKRQTQYVTKLLTKQENLAEVEQAFQALMGDKHQVDAEFHLAEHWRERLITESTEAMTEFMRQYTQVSSQELRHLIQKARKERRLEVNHGAARALFRLIKQVVSHEA